MDKSNEAILALMDEEDHMADRSIPPLSQADNIVLLVPPEQDHRFLGGVSEREGHTLSWIPELPKYASLPRPRMLSPWKGEISDPEVDLVFRMLHDEGRILFRMAMLPTADRSSLRMYIACGDQNRCPPKYQGILTEIVFKQIERVVNGRVYRGHSLAHNTINTSFRTFLPEEEKNALSSRALHVFLRQVGTDYFGSTQMDEMCMQLAQLLDKKKRYVDKMDVSIIAADVALKTSENKRKHFIALLRVGETLEAAGRFVDAAELYLEVASTLEGLEDSRSIAFLDAGLAYRRANLFEESEKAYVASMYWNLQSTGSRSSWDLNAETATNVFTNFFVMIDNLYEDESTEAAVKIDAGHIMAIFAAILYKAGFKAKSGGLTESTVFGIGPVVARELKKSSKNKTGAFKTLVKAVNTNDAQAFRAVLRDCVRAGRIFTPKRNAASQPHQDARTRRKEDKEAARESYAGPSHQLDTSRCSNPSCPSGQKFLAASELQNCPCRLARYCSKSCQVVDWADHKTICTARKKKAAAK